MNEKSYKNQLLTTHTVNVFEDNSQFLKNCISYTGPKEDSALCFSEEIDHKIVDKGHRAESIKCTICNISFQNRDDQRQHYFLDLHRVNAHRKASLKPPLSEEEFLDYIDESSNSESESDDITPSCEKLIDNIEFQSRDSGNFFSKHPLKTFYVTEQKVLFSVYKNLIIKNENLEFLDFGSIWVYLMLCAGDFAGAVFNKNEIVVHKTFHRYVIRAKSGTAQSVCDNQGGNAPKSAGSSLRRHNEAALKKEIQDLLLTWSDHINLSNRIFYKCSTYGMATLFGKKTNISKDDHRLCKISLSAQRPSFSEIKRLHLQYSKLYIHGLLDEIEEHIKKIKEKENKENNVLQNKSDFFSQNISNDLLRKDKFTKDVGSLSLNKKSRGFKDDAEILKQTMEQSSLQDNSKCFALATFTHPVVENFSLTSYQDSFHNKHDQIHAKSSKNNIPIVEYKQLISSKQNSREQDPSDCYFDDKKIGSDGNERKEQNNDDSVWMWNTIYKWCTQGNLIELKKFFQTISESESKHHQSYTQDNNVSKEHKSSLQYDSESKDHQSNPQYDSESKEHQSSPQYDIEIREYQSSKDSQQNGKLCFYEHLNYLSVSKNSTLLLRAIFTGHREIVAMLLDLGADPSISNTTGQLPYDLASQNMRREFRRFRYDYPNKYDYTKAKIGAPLTEVEEERKKESDAKKKKLQNKARKDKLKLRKIEEDGLKKVEQEKEIFENLSDREKRAVMAERRIAAQHTISSRCAHCRVAIDDKKAFEKYGFKYCCMKCVNEHKSIIGK